MAGPFGIGASSYDDIFLTADELPRMTMVQDARSRGADETDLAFGAHGGLAAGFHVWSGDEGSRIGRLVDARWVFPSAEAATAYHRESLRPNSEGRPAVPRPPMVGDGCTVFGGTEPNPLAPTVEMTAFTYVFRVGNVVVKLFAFAGPDVAATPLTPAEVAPIAERVAARVARGRGASEVTPPGA